MIRLAFGLRRRGERAEIKSEGKSGVSFTLRLPGGRKPVRLKAFGLHNVYNALAAAAAAPALGLGPDAIRLGLEMFTPYDKRFKLEEVGGIVLIDDSYNANPASMAAALGQSRGSGKSAGPLRSWATCWNWARARNRPTGSSGVWPPHAWSASTFWGTWPAVVAAGALEGGLPASAVIVARNHDEIAGRSCGENLIEGDACWSRDRAACGWRSWPRRPAPGP